MSLYCHVIVQLPTSLNKPDLQDCDIQKQIILTQNVRGIKFSIGIYPVGVVDKYDKDIFECHGYIRSRNVKTGKKR